MKLGRPALRWAVVGLAVLLAVAAVTVFAKAGAAQASSLSRGPSGWLAARSYLAARGARVTLWREPLERFTGPGVLVVTFPWQNGPLLGGADGIEAHLRRGGDVVLAWSGSSNSPREALVLEELGFSTERVRKAPLGPLAWRRFVREEWELRPAAGAAGSSTLRIWAPREMPELPTPATSSEVLWVTPSGRPAVARVKHRRGAVWLLPADALSNARLGEAGNAGLLEALLARLGPRWTFDELHHGLTTVDAAADDSFGRILDLVLLHLAVLYALAVLTLARRFGPPWQEQPVVTGSVGSFLAGLGALHHRLGHHAEAARRLLERTRELAPDLALPDDLARRAETAGAHDLVALAREVVALRRGARPTLSGDRP